MWQFCEQASKCCVQFASTLLLEDIPQNGRVRMLPPWKLHISVSTKVPTLSIWASFPMYVKRMVVMYCETVLRLSGIRPPALRTMEHPLICRWGCWRLRKFIYMMFVDIHLCIADKRHPQYVSATKVHRILDICKRFK